MAETQQTGTKNGNKDKAVPPAQIATVAKNKSKFVEESTDREIVNWETCAAKGLSPIVTGYLIGVTRMSEAGENDKPWDVLRLILTQPLKLANKEGDIYDVPIDTEVLVTLNYGLLKFVDVALDSENVYEVQISSPKTKTIGKGRTMREFKFLRSEQPYKRIDVAPLSIGGLENARRLFAPQNVAALPPAPFEG